MSAAWLIGASGLTAYLAGSIPFGLLIARSRGVDIRKVGSGNIGATNVFRTVGKREGIITFALDLLKGFLPAFLLPILLAPWIDSPAQRQVLGVVSACLAVAGHNWPVFLGFKGGKGVATSTGALLGLAWVPVLAGVVVWAAAFGLTRYVSVASMLAAVAVATAEWVLWFRDTSQGLIIPVALTVLAVLAIARHKANIQRLAAGTEHRFSSGKPK